ncbi:MAG TPA: hypothetical protein DCS93_17490 [Microscillaceae bacterium]|nr:hypothetical protein [Microscillaceae bacterium]
MRIVFRSIRARLFFYFMTFFLVIATFISISLWLDSEQSDVEKVDAGLAKINLQILTVGELERDFFENEITNSNFYKSRYSSYLSQRNKVAQQVFLDLRTLANTPAVASADLENTIDSIQVTLINYQKVFDQMIQLIIERGFKDTGKEGEMRRHIHEIESSKFTRDLTTVLMARRFEKDFIIRKDRTYANKVDSITGILKAEIQRRPIDAKEKKHLLNQVDRYLINFLELVAIEEKIGFNNQSGLRKDLNDSFTIIKNAILKINQILLTKNEQRHQYIQQSSFIVLGLFVVSFIVFSLVIARILSKPVKKLSDSIHEIVSQNFSQKVPLVKIQQQDEVGHLANDFSFMLERMHDYIGEIKSKSSNLEQKQRLLMDSIRYAQQIQRAILPENDEIQMMFEESFVIYKPAELVSGDFYWLNSYENKIFLAVVDCTGHGVPGAFMSMIGNTLLNKIVKENRSQNPSDILEELHIEVKIALHQEKHKNDDGMDVAFCAIEKLPNTPDEFKIVYAGAKRPLWYFNNGELSEIKGTKRSIGGQSKYRPFENHAFILPKGSTLYLASDGFNDQHNVERKKFGKMRLMSLIKQQASTSLSQQALNYEQALAEHMQGEVKQRDDITLIGVKL